MISIRSIGTIHLYAASWTQTAPHHLSFELEASLGRYSCGLTESAPAVAKPTAAEEDEAAGDSLIG